MKLSTTVAMATLLLGLGVLGANAAYASDDEQLAQSCGTMRKIKIGISVTPPNVVHTPPFVAKDLGYFAKHCIDAELLQFEGGLSQTMRVALSSGEAMGNMDPVAVANGLKGKQVWLMAPRMPQAYVVDKDIKTAADLKGKRLSASGGGVGSFNWLMGREVLKSAGLKPEDAKFIAAATAARLPGLVAGQIDGVALHPEDAYLAKQKNEGLHPLVQLADLLPNHVFNAYGASTAWIEKDRPLMIDAVAAMIEANRTIYREKDKVIPIIVKATGKPKEAVEYAWEANTKNCVWSVNDGFSKEREQWTIDNDVANGFIAPDKKPTVERVFDEPLSAEALKKVGGRVTIGKCNL